MTLDFPLCISLPVPSPPRVILRFLKPPLFRTLSVDFAFTTSPSSPPDWNPASKSRFTLILCFFSSPSEGPFFLTSCGSENPRALIMRTPCFLHTVRRQLHFRMFDAATGHPKSHFCLLLRLLPRFSVSTVDPPRRYLLHPPDPVQELDVFFCWPRFPFLFYGHLCMPFFIYRMDLNPTTSGQPPPPTREARSTPPSLRPNLDRDTFLQPPQCPSNFPRTYWTTRSPFFLSIKDWVL